MSNIVRLELHCRRCGEMKPRSEFARSAPGARRQHLGDPVCTSCRHLDAIADGLLGEYVEHRTRNAAALALLRLGLTVAAEKVLAGEPMPRLNEARAMQRRTDDPA